VTTPPPPSGDRAPADDGDVDSQAEAYCSTCGQSFAPDAERCPDDGTRLVQFAAQRDPLIGRTLDGRFEVRRPLGKGGMGTVYRALQISVDREVAVKVVHPRLANDRQAAKRFLREARLASRLNQPNVVQVIDFGQTDDGVLYLVMELLRGRTLASELGGERRFSVRRAITIGLQLCDALEAAHAQGIVHRDLKPGNIVVLDDPPGRDLIKVLDFGLAKSLIADTSQVTNTDAILGTPLYMSPEQVQGKPSDQRGDLYSLGCILFELLSGAPPFVDESVNMILAKHLGEAPPPLPAHVPARLRALIDQLLAKDPETRVQTAGEVRTVVQWVIDSGALAGGGLDVVATSLVDVSDTVPDVDMEYAATAAIARPAELARRSPAPAPATLGGAATTASSSAVGEPRRSSSRRALTLLAVTVLATLVVVIVAMTRSRDGGAVGAAPPRRRPVTGRRPPPTTPGSTPATPPVTPARSSTRRRRRRCRRSTPGPARRAVDAGILSPRDAGIPVYDAGRAARPRFDGGVGGPRPTPADAGTSAAPPPVPPLDFVPSR
jgi:tRNA A-37 threonylcarbamoyl transferase component Bud32